MERKNRNLWKILFLSLCFILVICIVGILIFINSFLTSSNDLERIPPTDFSSGGAEFTISTTKEDINYWLNKELEKEQGGVNSYELYLEDYVYFQTVLSAFGMNIPLEMRLEPVITEDGNIELIERSFQVGRFNVPAESVFNIIEATVDLPDWIYIYPRDRRLYLDIRNGISNEFEIKVSKFDLIDNQIEIKLLIP
ncbi:YpmS family protein [Evansella sp. AB-P1]|uniref:YpmS family protein n=1 Tax=Evansella sp. AB-P1 TaxID=3037653 RepID=UPI00241D48F7|nr:YpmS family protein [Evansella sp. AB-P1]MDG5786405.1 YpmS family protein [Evansella sp. AB-P1]